MDDKYLIVILVLAVLFGASRLPSLGRNVGQGIREFRKGIAEGAQGDDGDKASPADDSSVNSSASGAPRTATEASPSAGRPPAAGGPARTPRRAGPPRSPGGGS
jgi:sec-independent protein translocase protein TatA